MTVITATSSIVGNWQGRPFSIDQETRLRHLHLIGQTGSGKSTLLLNLIARDLRMGRGLALLDPHGDLAMRALASVPTSRAHELVYLNPGDLEKPIGLNLLSGVAEHLRPVIADGVVSAFKHVWPDFWGPRLEYILLNAVRLLMDAPGSTLLGLSRLLIDNTHRKYLLVHCRDVVVKRFWLNEYDSYDTRFRNEAIAPIQNKIGRLMSSPSLRNIISQPVSTIDFRKMMDEGRILIANLAKGTLGEGTSHLLGALLTTSLTHAALSRVDIREEDRRPFYLYADEFQNYASESFALILSEARKYRLALTLGHQYLAQLPDSLRHAVLGNSGSFIAFRIGAADAQLIAEHIGLRNQKALEDLSNFSAWGKYLVNGMPTDPMFLEMLPPPKPVNHRVAKLIANSRIRFGRDRAKVEGRIKSFLQ
jgi:Helicase HerA, central domain